MILWEEDIQNIEDLYEKVSSMISAKHKIKQSDIKEAFIKRDELGYMVFPDKSVIPHGRIENFDDIIIVIVKTTKPILISKDYADIFYCILTSNSGSNRYLRTLASFAKISSEHSENIRKCTNGAELMAYIEKCALELDNVIQIKDIVSGDVHTVKMNDTIETVADLMKKHNIIFLPVVDDKNHYLGKIDVLDVIKIIYPEYMNLISDISFLKNLRAFEEFENDVKNTTVADHYKKADKKIINQNENAVEVGYILSKNNWHHITVIDDEKKVVAVLSTRSFLNNILRA
jgi:mannitol/fructose-specific phosphotransferase system IIA component (Ntr-type)